MLAKITEKRASARALAKSIWRKNETSTRRNGGTLGLRIRTKGRKNYESEHPTRRSRQTVRTSLSNEVRRTCNPAQLLLTTQPNLILAVSVLLTLRSETLSGSVGYSLLPMEKVRNERSKDLPNVGLFPRVPTTVQVLERWTSTIVSSSTLLSQYLYHFLRGTPPNQIGKPHFRQVPQPIL